jgi:hypothetical protein
VITYERFVVWITGRFEGVSEGYRQDVALTARELGTDADPLSRWLELGALVALALRLRSRKRAGGRPSGVWHEGLRSGAILLVAALASVASANVADPAVLATPATLVLSLTAAIGLATAVGLGLRGRGHAAALLSAGSAAAYLSLSGHGAAPALFASASVLAVGGLLIGAPPRVPAGRRRAQLACLLPLVGLPIGLLVGSQQAASGTMLAFTLLLPVVLVIAGWFDPRAAAAATVLVLSRLLASGFDELGRALAVFAQEGQGTLLLRWILMSTGVLAAWFVTHQSIRRLFRP